MYLPTPSRQGARMMFTAGFLTSTLTVALAVLVLRRWGL